MITWIAGVLIIFVTAVPTPYAGFLSDCPTPICHQGSFWGTIHFGSAAAFFIAMEYLSAFHFTRGHKPFSSDKYTRNTIYRFCGFGMWLVLVVTGILFFILELSGHPIFWVEVILLLLFGASWNIKRQELVDLGIQKDDQ